MTDGVIITLAELIALRRYAERAQVPFVARGLNGVSHGSPWRGRGMDFSEVRNYQAGDEIRHMEWRVTARTGRPHVKLYQEERERSVIILVDFNPSMYFGTRVAFKSVIAARLAALLAWTAVKQGDRVGGLLFSQTTQKEFIPQTRQAGILPFLAALSQYTEAQLRPSLEGRCWSEVLLRLRRVSRPGSIIVLISDFYQWDHQSEEHINRLCSHNDVLIYQIRDPLEISPPKPGQYAMTDGQETIVFDVENPLIQAAYQRYCDEHFLSFYALLRRLHIHYTEVTANMDLPLLVWQTFPRRRYD